MDLQTLSQLFATTYNPDPNVRKAAELQIRKIENEQGMITAVLQIVASDSVELATRQACSVWLKNRVNTTYPVETPPPEKPDHFIVSPAEREALRVHILPLLAASPSRGISLQIASALKSIIAHDFPSKWPALIPELKKLLSSSNVQEVHAGCVASLEAVRAFRFRSNADVLPAIIAEIFPLLHGIARQGIDTFAKAPTAAQEIPAMLHLILKTYRTSIIINLSPHQQTQGSLMPWGKLFFDVVNLRLPKEAVPEDLEERERSEWWKAKKWAYATLGRLFHRFGNPSQLPSQMRKSYGPFAQQFSTVFAPEILSIYLRQVELFVSNQEWMSSKCQYQIFYFLTECVKPKQTWALLKPHFETLISTFVFKHLIFTESKRELWEADPVDYVRVSIDEYETYNTPVSAATTFLLSLASKRTKATFLPILGFINNVLRAHGPPEERFGALNMTAALGGLIMRHPEVRKDVETFLVSFVSPELEAPEPYVRAIALEIIGTVVKQGFAWSNEDLLRRHFQAVSTALESEILPIKVQAALTLTEMVIHFESVREALKPQVEKLIQAFLKLSDETDLDLLNHSLEVMVDTYQAEIPPVATALADRLCSTYLRLARESAIHDQIEDGADFGILEANPDDEDKTFAALSIAKTIDTLISCVDGHHDLLLQIQELVIPIVTFTLDNRLFDQYDHMYDLVDNLTYQLKGIAPGMWPIFEATYKLFKTEAIDFLEEMLPSLDNFITYGADVIKTRPDYKEMLVDMYTTAITSDSLGENDRIKASELIEAVLLNLREHVDEYLQTIVNTALGLRESIETSALRLANFNVLINAVLYNPASALHFIENFEAGMSRTFFNEWFDLINNADKRLPRVHDVKLSLVALSSIIELSPEIIPEPVRDGWPGILAGILKLFERYPKALEARQKLMDQEVESDDEDSDDSDQLNLDDNEDDVWDADSRYMEALVNASMKLRAESGRAEGIDSIPTGDEDEDEDEEDDEYQELNVSEDLGYISPLDNINPYIAFNSGFNLFQARNPNVYHAATINLTVDQQTALMEIMKKSQEATAAAETS